MPVDPATLLPFGQGRLETLSTLLAGMMPSDASAESLLAQKIYELNVGESADEYETRWVARLRDLSALRALIFGREGRGKLALRQGFAYGRKTLRVAPAENEATPAPSLQDITESAILVADLYWKLYRTCAGEFPELGKVARKLFEAIFQVEYSEPDARLQIAHLTDAMQRDHGVPFLLLNLMRQGREQTAREVAQLLLVGDAHLDEEIRTPLYWMNEIFWFARRSPLADYDATIRHLYHLCFTNPDRAGFLEIDSQFFPEFEMVSEIAREAFDFRETLIEWMLLLWREYRGLLDSPFQNVLATVARRQSKMMDTREAWESYWKRERDNFSRDYLLVAEGNLAYAAGHYQEAAECYRAALSLTPTLRSARLNLLFCLAQLGERDRLRELATEVSADKTLGAAALYNSGNALALAGDMDGADAIFAALQGEIGWEEKTDYYRSTFLFAHRRFEDALRFARKAARNNRHDAGIQYHLSLCYNALGDKGEALKTLQQMTVVPQVEWLDYYRFTLERDAGEHGAASETLKRIPREYFEDEEELEDALRFARGQRDLGLLRHLKRPS